MIHVGRWLELQHTIQKLAALPTKKKDCQDKLVDYIHCTTFSNTKELLLANTNYRFESYLFNPVL